MHASRLVRLALALLLVLVGAMCEVPRAAAVYIPYPPGGGDPGNPGSSGGGGPTNPPPHGTPEPATLTMVLIGAGMMGVHAIRRRRLARVEALTPSRCAADTQ
jgi:hypothetical protein